MTKIISSPIPTNIITGFLGVGKTTAIRHLLRKKPPDERWAILVNEFGEIGKAMWKNLKQQTHQLNWSNKERLILNF